MKCMMKKYEAKCDETYDEKDDKKYNFIRIYVLKKACIVFVSS